MKNLSVFILVTLAVMSGIAGAYVNYEAYEGTWDNLPDFDTMTPTAEGVVSNFDISVRTRDEGFGVRFSAYITIAKAGQYKFYTTSDDGSRLYIDDKLVVNNDGLHGMQQASGSIDLTSGEHTIVVEMFDKTGGEGLIVAYEGAGIDKQIVPDEVLSLIDPIPSYKATNPMPADNADSVSPGAILKWQSPALVQTPLYDIYFGTDPNFNSDPVLQDHTEDIFDPSTVEPMDPGTTYYWRVDVFDANDGGTPKLHTGEKWTFTTRYDLVAFYDFNVDANDVTGNGHSATYVSAGQDPNIVEDARKGNVIHLNPDGQGDGQYLNIGALGFGPGAHRTIAGWVKADTASIPDWTSVFGFAQNGAGTNTYFDVEVNSAGQFVLHVHGWEGVFCPVDTQWHHFAATYNGLMIKLYLDGKLVLTQERVLSSIVDDFRIGSRLSHKTYFPGLLDYIGVWDYALSSDEIRKMVFVTDFDYDDDVDLDDLGTFAAGWLDSTIIPDSVMPTRILEDFEIYNDSFPKLNNGWFVYLHDSGKYDTFANYPGTLITGQPESPYGGEKFMKIHYEFPGWDEDDWLVLGRRFATGANLVDLAKYDEIRFRVKYHADNTEDVGLVIHGAVDPPGVVEHEAFTYGPLPTIDDPADPNQWHEIVIDLRNDGGVDWVGNYTGVDDVHYMHAILVSIVNSSRDARTGTLYFDDFRLIDHTPDCDGLPAVDINADCVVDFRDYVYLAEEWLRGT